MIRILTLPGYTGSSPGHWQSLWEAEDARLQRVEQEDWDHPDPDVWSAAIEAAVRHADMPVVLVGHSCGSLAVAHWAARHFTAVAGAFLVAPPDCARPDLDEPIRRFAVPELRRLPCPAVVIASETDPYCRFDQAARLAEGWGAAIVSAGDAGHISTASGHGPWPEGRERLREFLARVASAP